jgi:hypothetical protein
MTTSPSTMFSRPVAGLATILQDPGVRYGIKYGLAGVLAFFISLAARLDTPSWSVVTVFVLMLAKYVGAVAEKAVFRVVGTVIGGITGYLLTGSLQQEPLIYLPLVGLAVGFATMMFGQTRAPYAFFLFGLTTLVVASHGLDNPSMSWQVALTRTEEVLVGVIASLLVTSLVWPVFARDEFRREVSKSLLQLGEAHSMRFDFFLGRIPQPGQVPDIESGLMGLRNLLHFGSRESRYFNERLPTYEAIVRCLLQVGRLLDRLAGVGVIDPVQRDVFGGALGGMTCAIRAAFADLANGRNPSSSFAAWDSARADVTRAAMVFAADPALRGKVDTGRVLVFADWLLASDDLRKILGDLHGLMDSLPMDVAEQSRERAPTKPPPLDFFHVKNGVRAGLACAVALMLQDWLNPPGGAMLTLAVFVFCAMTRGYPGGIGDLRAFHFVVYATAGGIVYALALLLLSPVLTSYAALNILLFAAMFLFGWLSFRTPGISIGMQFALLGTVGVLGLNAQEPVSFQSIVGVPIGIVFGLLVSAIIQRLIWPCLPQWQLRDRLDEWINHCRVLLNEGKGSWRLGRLGVLPAECGAWIGALRPAQASSESVSHLRKLVAELGGIDARLPPPVPGSTLSLQPEEIQRLAGLAEEIKGEVLAVLGAAIDKIHARPDELAVCLGRLEERLSGWMDEASSARAFVMEQTQSLDERLPVYALLLSWRDLGETALAFGRVTDSINWHHLMADAVL